MSTAINKVNGTEVPAASHAESWARAGIADAEAEAIRARTAAEIEERLIRANAEAEAVRIKAAEEAERMRIANSRAALRFEREQAVEQAKIAKANREAEDEERLAAAARKAAEDAEREEAEAALAVEASTSRWRYTAMGFYGLCAAVALPVQMAAFYKPDAKYLLVAPVFIEVIALVALVGAAAAVTARRPHWHYRAVAWAGALVAASVNLWHGLEAFDPATAVGTALASIAGPGMWDLHEHGRIARRDGVPTWRERRANDRAAKKAAAEQAVTDKRVAAEQKAARKAAEEVAAKLAAERAEHFPDVWKHAIKLAAALGETTVTEAVWKRAHLDIEGTEPSESAAIIRGRNAAARRVAAARSEAPGEKPVKVTKSQAAVQMKPLRNRSAYRPTPPRRTKGDSPRFHAAARSVMSDAKRQSNAAANTDQEM